MVVVHAVVASGNRPKFVDIDLVDYNMDLRALKRALTPHTGAVVATHMYGYPTDVDAIRAAVGDEKVIIVEDSAQSIHLLSSESGGLRGDLGLFSFGPGKPLSTFEGGVVVTNSSNFYEKIKAYRDKEMNRPLFKAQVKRWARFLVSYKLFRRGIYALWHQNRTKLIGSIDPEFNLTPDYMPDDMAMAYPDFQARLGLVQLSKLDLILARRRALARLYDYNLHGLMGICPAPLVENATYAFYTLRVSNRDKIGFRQHMVSRGVAVGRTYNYVLPHLKPWRPFASETYPRAAQAAREVVNLPCYPGLQEAQARYISACVREFANEINYPSSL
jgi:dTDP-4-amino-4,6-dideoxygalactose transaminase